MTIGWILIIVILIVSFVVSQILKSKFNKYSKIPLSSGMTGRDVAEKMLHDNAIYDVKVISTGGMLTDHYNPA
ncbi:MAG: zinc metallopeptidase, partial [Prevotella sp.]|nr:zinc metallopeptidase [Prevotella sp.]